MASTTENVNVAEETMPLKEHRSNVKQKVFEYLTGAVHVLILGYVLFLVYLCLSNEFIFFTWHPLLLALGWILLMSEGILMLASSNFLGRGLALSHKVKVRYHWVMQAIAVACCFSGFTTIYILKDLRDKPHFHTWHGVIGLISISCCIPSVTSGVVALYSFTFKAYVKPINSKSVHRACGVVTFLFGSVTILLSLYTNWFQRDVTYLGTILWFIAFLIIVIVTVLEATVKVLNRLKSMLQ